MAGMTPDAIVVGAGVIGLTTGICLAEAGLRVQIRTEVPPPRTTSAAAGAMVGPPSSSPGDRAWAWEQATLVEFTELATVADTGLRALNAACTAPLRSFLAMRHRFGRSAKPEVVAIAGCGDHCFRELLPILLISGRGRACQPGRGGASAAA
jgi:glycine/D-amino acid oxidase-like deaminating enzyme